MLVDADKVKSLRLEKGWTQEQLAELCDISVRTVQRIEKTGTASLDTSGALAAVFETDRTEILAKGGMQTARTEFSLRHVVTVAAITFLVGVGIGVIV